MPNSKQKQDSKQEPAQEEQFVEEFMGDEVMGEEFVEEEFAQQEPADAPAEQEWTEEEYIEKEPTQKEHAQKKHVEKEPAKKEAKKAKADQVIAKLPPVDQINPGKKQKQASQPQQPEAAASVAAAAPPPPQQPEEMVQMGGGLPALPARPPVPHRQAQATVSSAFSNGKMAQRLPNVKQASSPQLNIPAGSDLGAVGKIGAYQMAQIKPKNTSSATQIHANMLFWVCALLFVTIMIMKKQ